MKKSVLNLLRGGVFALAAVAAFAFTQPMPNTPIYATPDGGQNWVEVTNLEIDEDYECVPGSEACTYSSPSMEDPIGPQNRKFRLL